MLNGVHLVDFGNHRNTRLAFGRMTAFVGQNGSGKTTVMRAVQEVDRAIRDPDKWSQNPEFWRKRTNEAIVTAGWQIGTNPANYGGVRLTDDAQWYTCQAAVDDHGHADLWIPDPEMSLGLPPGRLADIPLDERPSEIDVGFDHIARRHDPPGRWRCRYFKANASSLQFPAVADPETLALNEDGSNLAWALSNAMTEEPDRFARIVDSLRDVVPVVKRVRSRTVTRTRVEKQIITIGGQDRAFDEERKVPAQELVFDMRSGDSLPATSVSEGTLVVLALLTLVHGSEDTDLLMLDDIELGLHPKAQRDLIRQLRRIQQSHPKVQILVSTHSPYIIDEFDAGDVWVFAPDKEGCAVTKRLSDHPNARRALEVLTTGEFWSAEGEPWVLEEASAARVAEEPRA